MLSKPSNLTGPFEKKLWRIMQKSNKPYKRKIQIDQEVKLTDE